MGTFGSTLERIEQAKKQSEAGAARAWHLLRRIKADFLASDLAKKLVIADLRETSDGLHGTFLDLSFHVRPVWWGGTDTSALEIQVPDDLLIDGRYAFLRSNTAERGSYAVRGWRAVGRIDLHNTNGSVKIHGDAQSPAYGTENAYQALLTILYAHVASGVSIPLSQPPR